jgi:hypothetical protein
MAKLKDGIEVGEYQTSGVNDDVKEGESKPRGGEGSAIMGKPKGGLQPHHFAHSQPVT